MLSVLLLLTVTVLYAGYNLFIKLAGNHVPATATSTIAATICLQLAALATSLAFLGYLTARGEQSFGLSTQTYLWALAAGLCIGGAEIAYLYLFGGLGSGKGMAASTAIPVIVSGTVVISMIFSVAVLREAIAWPQIAGSLMIVCGIALLFYRAKTGTGHY